MMRGVRLAPAILASESAICESGVEKSESCTRRQQQSDDPVNVVVREQGYQRQDSNDFILNLPRPVAMCSGRE
jgi:hypothetical protein